MTIVGVNSAREYEMRFICPKHSVKPVVLLFHLIEYQESKAGGLDYATICEDTVSGLLTELSKHFRVTLLSVSKLLKSSNPHVHKPPTWIAPSALLFVATTATTEGSPLLGRDTKKPVASIFFNILFNAGNSIAPLPPRKIYFMK